MQMQYNNILIHFSAINPSFYVPLARSRRRSGCVPAADAAQEEAGRTPSHSTAARGIQTNGADDTHGQ